MKQYLISKIEKFGIKIKKINYDFKIQNTNKPTRFIKIIVHHTGKSRTIQQIIDLHVKKNRWSSIGYHFMIGKRGQIYYSRDLKFAGAHTFGYNKNSIGIALFGNLDETEPTKKQIKSLKELINSLEENYKIKTILGHNQAIYELLKKRYYKTKLENRNPLNINTKEKYNKFLTKISTQILKNDADKYTVDLLQRLKTCPGINMYNNLKKIQKEQDKISKYSNN